jgi:hypothetical protein
MDQPNCLGLDSASGTQQPCTALTCIMGHNGSRRGFNVRSCSTHPGTDAGAVQADCMRTLMSEIIGERASCRNNEYHRYDKGECPGRNWAQMGTKSSLSVAPVRHAHRPLRSKLA